MKERAHNVQIGVNIDHVATLRQARRGQEPDVLAAARVVAKTRATGITVHLREDRRHIQDEDVVRIKNEIDRKLNLEMSLADEIVRFALELVPEDVCIVPEKREEITTEGGLNLVQEESRLKTVIPLLRERGIRVSLFIDPDPDQVRFAAELGADCVELHTGAYAETADQDADRGRELERLRRARDAGSEVGLIVNAGHGLNYDNVGPVAAMKGVRELNIGHSIVSRAVFVGLYNAIEEMIDLVENAVLTGET